MARSKACHLLVEGPFRLFETWINAQKLNTMVRSASVGVSNISHNASRWRRKIRTKMGQEIRRALSGKHVIHSIKDHFELPFLATKAPCRVKRLARTHRWGTQEFKGLSWAQNVLGGNRRLHSRGQGKQRGRKSTRCNKGGGERKPSKASGTRWGFPSPPVGLNHGSGPGVPNSGDRAKIVGGMATGHSTRFSGKLLGIKL